jgi:hypothetical protein
MQPNEDTIVVAIWCHLPVLLEVFHQHHDSTKNCNQALVLFGTIEYVQRIMNVHPEKVRAFSQNSF